MELKADNIYAMDCLSGLKQLPDESIQCCVTSPPYWRLRNYGVDGQLGLESSPEAYVDALIVVFNEVKRVLKPNGTLWLNLGDIYWGSGKTGKNTTVQAKQKKYNKGSKHISRFDLQVLNKNTAIKSKDLVGFPWMVAFALRKQGWYLRQDIIWQKDNPMPESVTDRCTKAHEYIFLLSKNKKYYFNHKGIQTPAKGKTLHDRSARISKKGAGSKLINHISKPRGPYEMANRRSVWSVNNKPFNGAHFACFPLKIPQLCIMAGSKDGDIVLDPFMGAGTTAVAAAGLNRSYIGFELNPEYVQIAQQRIQAEKGL